MRDDYIEIRNAHQENSLSFCFLNINGLTVEKVECITNMITNFDFFAVVETWLKNDSHDDFSVDGYILQCYNRTSLNPRARRGSGGIALYIREQLVDGVETVSDVNLSSIDDRVWFRLCKDFFGLDNDLYLGVWYIPPSDSCRCTQTQDMWAVFKYEISHIQGRGDVILMGDLNARTGELKDWIEMDQRDKVPLPHEYIFDKYIKPRVSMDKIVNSSGQMLIDTCIATGL